MKDYNTGKNFARIRKGNWYKVDENCKSKDAFDRDYWSFLIEKDDLGNNGSGMFLVDKYFNNT